MTVAKAGPITEEERHVVRQLDGEGWTRHVMARHSHRSGRTVSNIVAALGPVSNDRDGHGSDRGPLHRSRRATRGIRNVGQSAGFLGWRSVAVRR
ncbi:hypothetical protein [Streptomyces sp. 8L]|uniref:hypothetical protein n=1 Tax=Streptomyces sp. 8L TaxID=2877242 RepID=UPI001CD595C7|nr:hypothetical protein [Streptomyces sp. 8L]MCA1221907.1 hypothetical protein [Streptomyces sp. 8L]